MTKKREKQANMGKLSLKNILMRNIGAKVATMASMVVTKLRVTCGLSRRKI